MNRIPFDLKHYGKPVPVRSGSSVFSIIVTSAILVLAGLSAWVIAALFASVLAAWVARVAGG